MKKIILTIAILSGAVSVWATTTTKGETAHPVYGHKFTYE